MVEARFGKSTVPIGCRSNGAPSSLPAWVREHNWTQRQAAGLCCVNAGYVGLVQRLSDEDRIKLARRELKLSHLWQFIAAT